ncbi:small ribosomal subunit protein bS16m-like [Saccoglossus kowalevskii]|uniref:Small ribosomal subunit protein bS16m n=1 Tax=Saccoglossus kowalevskii TaxID=10224 RepID=A0ABM0GYW7_SACKO|nr:PREDICTED: 28S ribosomal protein S16, mitochondrial-like [Saccoglossus kowalevskii]
MVLRIRLALHGCTNRPFYHLVVINHLLPRNHVPLEHIGSYDPMPNKHNEKLVAVNFERLKYWIAEGAELTKPSALLLGLSGFFPIHPMSFVQARRARNKAKEEKAATAQQESETNDNEDDN